MNNNTAQPIHHDGDWEQHKQKLQEKFPVLNVDDLHFEPGKSDDMFRKVLLKTGKTKGELAAVIATIISEYGHEHTN